MPCSCRVSIRSMRTVGVATPPHTIVRCWIPFNPDFNVAGWYILNNRKFGENSFKRAVCDTNAAHFTLSNQKHNQTYQCPSIVPENKSFAVRSRRHCYCRGVVVGLRDASENYVAFWPINKYLVVDEQLSARIIVNPCQWCRGAFFRSSFGASLSFSNIVDRAHTSGSYARWERIKVNAFNINVIASTRVSKTL